MVPRKTIFPRHCLYQQVAGRDCKMSKKRGDTSLLLALLAIGADESPDTCSADGTDERAYDEDP